MGVRPRSLAELAQQPNQVLPRREAARHEAGGPLRRVPAAEVGDHRLRMHRRVRVGRELAHGRRAAQTLGGALQLGDDLLVAVAAAQPGLERLQRLGIDAIERANAAAGGHSK